MDKKGFNMEDFKQELYSTQGRFALISLKAEINFSSKLIGFNGKSSDYIKSNLNSNNPNAIWARGVFYHEMIHYYQNTMTPIGVFIRLLNIAKTFLTFNFMANEGLKKEGVAIKDLQSNTPLYQNFMVYYHAISDLQQLMFGLKNYTQKEAFHILTNGLGVCNILGTNAPNLFGFLKIDKPLNYILDENTPAIPTIQDKSTLFNIKILFEGWASCVQIAEYINSLYFEDDKLNEDLHKVLKKVFHAEYKIVPESVSLKLYNKKLLELESDELFIVVNITKIIVELSLYSPIHPSFVEIDDKEGIEWTDIYPSWRFLKALSVLDEIDLYGIDNYQDSFDLIIKTICNKFNWKQPQEFSSKWNNIKDSIDLKSSDDDINTNLISQKKILQAYDASISIKEELGMDIFTLYPHRATQLTTPRKGNQSLLIPPVVLFKNREMMDIDNFTSIFFQYILSQYISARFNGFSFNPRDSIKSFFANRGNIYGSELSIEKLVYNVNEMIDKILN